MEGERKDPANALYQRNEEVVTSRGVRLGNDETWGLFMGSDVVFG